MEQLESQKGISLFKFTHSRQYQEVQQAFLECVESFDPNNVVRLLEMVSLTHNDFYCLLLESHIEHEIVSISY